MRNPLDLPLVALTAVLELPRAIGNIARANELLERSLERIEVLNEQGDRLLAELADARTTVDRMMAGGDELVAAADRATREAAAAREAIERAAPTAERIADSAPLVLEALQRAQPSAERLAETAGPILDASVRAREQLEETQVELARANAQVGRALELVQPLERVTDRVERLTGPFRRESRDGDGSSPGSDGA